MPALQLQRIGVIYLAVTVWLTVLLRDTPLFALPSRPLHASAVIDDLGFTGPDVGNAFEEISGIIDKDLREGLLKGNHRNFGHWGFGGSIPFDTNPALQAYIKNNPGAKEEIIALWTDCSRQIENCVVGATGIPAGKQAHGLATFVYDHHLLCDYADTIIQPLQPVSEIHEDLIQAARDAFGRRHELAERLKKSFDAIPKDISLPEQARMTLDALREDNIGAQLSKTFPKQFAAGKLRLIEETTRTPLGEAFAIGKTLARSNTLELETVDELIARVPGKPSSKAFQKYGEDFAAYWEASRTQRSDTVLEAVAAFTENRRLARSGNAADLLLTEADLVVREHHQYKLGWQAARGAITDTKYVGMTIVAPVDQMEILARELAKAEAKAMRRGLPLKSEWEVVRQAIEEGRVTSRLPSGAIASTRKDILRVARRQLQAAWSRLERVAEVTGAAKLLKVRPVSGTLKVLGKVGGGALVVLDIGATGYQTYNDAVRYCAGEIGGGYLATKSAMRGVQLGLAYYTLFAPDLTLITKVATGVAVIVLIVADDVSDRVYGARRDQARRLLEAIDRDERFSAARRQLLGGD